MRLSQQWFDFEESAITHQGRNTMTQEVFPEIQAAKQALENQIALTQAEIDQMKETIASKKQLVKDWRKAIAAVNPQLPKNKAVGAS